MNFIKLDKPIATIDIETYALSLNAVVDEIGVIITDVLPVTVAPLRYFDLSEVIRNSLRKNLDSPLNGIHAGKIRLDAVEQIAMGRAVDPGTMAFRVKAYGSREEMMQDYHSVSPRSSVEEARRSLRGYFQGLEVAEIWFNHTQFDVPRLSHLLEGGKDLYWNFRLEKDVFTAKTEARKIAKMRSAVDPLHIPSGEGHGASHQSLDDCLYNLWVLAKLHEFYRDITGLGGTYINVDD